MSLAVYFEKETRMHSRGSERTALDCEMPNSPDTLRVLLTRFIFMA